MNALVQLLVLVLSRNVHSSNECNKGSCGCCKNKVCKEDKLRNLYCSEGCVDGYYGNQCRHACQAYCLTCKSIHNCDSCKPGYTCPFNCGLSEKCSNCSAPDTCSRCKIGYYGVRCNNKCSYGCRSNACNTDDGSCKCKHSYTGEKCNRCYPGKYGSFCNRSCPIKCLTCDNWDSCSSCKKGFWGPSCKEKCSIGCNTCHIATAKCNSDCKDGYYGHNCEPSQKNGERCSSQTSCLACVQGFYGPMCSLECPRNCRNRTCHKLDGKCLECNVGFFGRHCEHNCTERCTDRKCYRYTGECISCISGNYGVNCTDRCPMNCLTCLSETQRSRNCLNETCDTITGHCNGGCVNGYWGNMCKTRCSENCDNEICNRTNGECTSGCKEGKWGVMCDTLCSNNCQKCDQKNGTCLLCKAGKYLSDCSKSCNTNCNASNSEQICAIKNGACLNGCDTPDKYGKRCENACNSNCLDNKCDWKTGDCANGCNVGYFGNSCDQICSVNCVNNTCRRTTGTCLFGCILGYEGSDCMQKASKAPESDNKVKISLAIAIVVLVTIIVGAAVTFLIIKRRNNQGKAESSNLGENNFNNAAVTYSEVRAREIEIDVDNAVYAKPNKPKKRSAEESKMTYKPNNVPAVMTASNQLNKLENDKRKTDVNLHYEDNAVYAKPNKPKKRTAEESKMTYKPNNVPEVITASNNLNKTESDKRKTVGNLHYAESINDTDLEKNTSFDDITKTTFVSQRTRSKSKNPSLAAKPGERYKNTNVTESIIRKSRAEYALSKRSSSVLEVEEDLGNITSLASNMDQFRKECLTREKEGEYAYYNVAEVKKRKVPLNKLAEYISKKTKEEFMREFDTLPVGLIKPFTESQKTENLTKNRYRGLYPYDQRRVILKGGDSDYINASYVDGYKKIKAYIASIGPTYRYMEDMSPFWRMVWQEKTGKIVMLTKLSEAGVPKCDRYWPEKDCSILFADISVRTEREEAYADYTVRYFILQKDSKATNVVQIQFMAWPDKGIPDDVTSLIDFRQKVNNISTDLDGPVVVHCSAGVGRTGTYIAIDSLIQEGEAEGAVDIYACVRNLREQRVNMVQTAEQYQYLHNVVVHTLTFGSKPVKASKFHEYISTHEINQLENQFQQLEAFVESRSDHEKEAVRLNKELKDQNRSGADIPGDNNRPRLYLRRKQGISGYINAIYINSFRTKNRFLVAQTPMPNTAEDFLVLIVQENVSCIVTLEPSLNGNQTVGTYYPDDSQPLKVGSCTVQSEKAECTDQYVQRKLKILHQGKSSTQEITVTHIQFTKWIERQMTPDDLKMFMRFMKDIELKCDGDDKERPILVHCLTGAEKSGLFCVVSILLEKIQLEQEISVVNTVRQVKNRRHRSIPNKEQYIFCHQCLDEYLHTFDTYSNFCLEK